MTRNDKKWAIETTDTPGILVAKVMIMMIHHRIFLGRIVFWGDGSMVGTLESQENYQKVAEESEVTKILELLQSLLGSELQQASQDARIAASSFVDKRKGQLLGGRCFPKNVTGCFGKPVPLVG